MSLRMPTRESPNISRSLLSARTRKDTFSRCQQNEQDKYPKNLQSSKKMAENAQKVIADAEKSNKMNWTNEHNILFLRELLVSNPFQHRACSRERGTSWDTVAATLNSIHNPVFKLDQRAIRDHVKKMLKDYALKKSFEERASGIAPEQTEMDVLLEELQTFGFYVSSNCDLNKAISKNY